MDREELILARAHLMSTLKESGLWTLDSGTFDFDATKLRGQLFLIIELAHRWSELQNGSEIEA
jgi:hypothetical protein